MKQNRLVKMLGQTGLLLTALAVMGTLHIASAQKGRRRNLAPATITSQSDFNGDQLSDFVFFNPADGQWLIHNMDATVSSVYFGMDGDKPIAADYDGDNIVDLSVVRNGGDSYTWYILQSSNGALRQDQWGTDKDVPVQGDYDGDGKADLAVWRPRLGVWYILNSSTGTPSIVTLGTPSDKPVPGDYDGDGKTDVAIYQASDSSFVYMSSLTSLTTSQPLVSGMTAKYGDVFVPADYDGDGKTDFAVFNEIAGSWVILESSTGNYRTEQIGHESPLCTPTEVRRCYEFPLHADYDNDGKVDPSIWNARSGNLFILGSLNGDMDFATYTTPEMIPVPAFYTFR